MITWKCEACSAEVSITPEQAQTVAGVTLCDECREGLTKALAQAEVEWRKRWEKGTRGFGYVAKLAALESPAK